MTLTAAGTRKPPQPARRKAGRVVRTGLVLVALSTVLLGMSVLLGATAHPPPLPAQSTTQTAPAPAGDPATPGAENPGQPDAEGPGLPHAGGLAPSPPSGGDGARAPQPAPAPPIAAPQPVPAASTTWTETAAMLSALGGLISGFAGLVTAIVGVATMRRANKIVRRATIGD